VFYYIIYAHQCVFICVMILMSIIPHWIVCCQDYITISYIKHFNNVGIGLLDKGLGVLLKGIRA